MTKVISFLSAWMKMYCAITSKFIVALMGYTHEWVESAFITRKNQHRLRTQCFARPIPKSSKENELVLMLDAHGAIMHPPVLEQSQDRWMKLVISGPTEVNKPEIAQQHIIVR